MKKLLIVTSLALTALVLTACSGKEKFYILNWQEYIDESLIEKFEDEYNVKVISENLISNELMYSSIQQNSAPYDVIFPSDYMVEKLSNEDLLVKLDQRLLDNKTEYTDGLDKLIEECGYENYFVPYFWGSLGIMYNTSKPDIKGDVEGYAWEIFFDEDMTSKYEIGMYDASRDSFAAAQMYLGGDINKYSNIELDKCAELLGGGQFSMWGDDNLKGQVSNGFIDLALVYSGDFFDQLYADDFSKDSYEFFAPQTNNIFFDAMCIPTTSKNVDLAHAFINFMIKEENAVQNAGYIGYCPTFQDVFEITIADEDMLDVTTHPGWNPQNISNGTVYKDLGDTYNAMEDKFNDLRVG